MSTNPAVSEYVATHLNAEAQHANNSIYTDGEAPSVGEESCWTQHEDPDSGDLYWYNELTGESSWDPPKISS